MATAPAIEIERLPLVDEHAVDVAAGAEDLWAVLADLDGDPGWPGGSTASAYARAVGCDDVLRTGPRPLVPGSTFPGFRVVAVDAPTELVLAGRHRFSTYALVLRVEAVGTGRSRLSATTRATFPGPLGVVYGAAVVRTGFHAAAVRRLLAATVRRAERRAAAGRPG